MQPAAFSQGNTRSSWLVQNRFVAEGRSGTSFVAERVGWNTLPGPRRQSRHVAPGRFSRRRPDRPRRPLRWEKYSGEFSGRHMNEAIRAPSGENAGELS